MPASVVGLTPVALFLTVAMRAWESYTSFDQAGINFDERVLNPTQEGRTNFLTSLHRTVARSRRSAGTPRIDYRDKLIAGSSRHG